MFKLYALAFLLVSASAFSIDLDKKEIPVEGSPVSEILYTTDVNFGTYGQPQRLSTVFDIASVNTWVIDPAQCKDCLKNAPGATPFNCEEDQSCKKSDTFGGSAFGFAGQLQFTSKADGPKKNVYREATDVYTIANEQFNNMDIILPQGVLPQPRDTSYINYFSKAQASIGLGSSYSAFLEGINNSKHSKVRIDSKQYSLYLGAANKLVFGSPEGYFKTGDFQDFRNTKNVNSGILKDSFSLKANSIKIGEAQIPLSVSASTKDQPRTSDTYGVFSSTSKFINFQDAGVLQKIVDQINKQSNGQANCVEIKDKKFYYQCDSVDQLPTLDLELTDGHSTKSFALDPADYTEPISVEGGVAKHLLLLRKGLTGYENFQLGAFASPGSTQYIWLGYPFFNRYYVNFNFEKDDISIAHKYQFEPQNKNLNKNNRLLFLIIGGIATIALVGYLLSQLTQVPYDPQTMPVNYEALHATPTKQVILTNQSQGSPLRYIAQSTNKYELRPAQTLSNFVSVPQKATYFPPLVKSQRSPGRTYQIQH